MVVLGLGLGMTMQVLVLAAQNAVDYELLGVATSGSTLFRQIGGSIGVAMFGAIFANRLAVHLASALPPGVRPPKAANPDLVSAPAAARPRALRRRVRRLAAPGVPGCRGRVVRRVRAHVAAARGSVAPERRRRGRRGELRLAARGGVPARAPAHRRHARASGEPLAGVRPARRARRRRPRTGRALAEPGPTRRGHEG